MEPAIVWKSFQNSIRLRTLLKLFSTFRGEVANLSSTFIMTLFWMVATLLPRFILVCDPRVCQKRKMEEKDA